MTTLEGALHAAERARITALKRDMQTEALRRAEREAEAEARATTSATAAGAKRPREGAAAAPTSSSSVAAPTLAVTAGKAAKDSSGLMSTALSVYEEGRGGGGAPSSELEKMEAARRRATEAHNPWRVRRVLVGHAGWVRCVALDPSNEWFATGSVDTTIKVWDLATGRLRRTFEGHKETVRGVAISSTSPYMFSASDDRSVKCWDLEANRIIRDYHGHGGAVNTIATHPALDLIVTGSRDRSVKLWDVRSQRCVHSMEGHKDAVMCLATQTTEPQITSGGSDAAVFLWDIRTGRPVTNLTRHKKPVEALVAHPTEETLVSVGADNIRKWKLPLGVFYTNMVHETVRGATAEGPWCCAALSPWGELCVAGRDGTLRLYDWSTHILLQQTATRGVNGGDKGIFCCAFDASGKRLITGEMDKTVKIWEPKAPAAAAAAE